jgi:CheY-like chemotaxis protein
MTSETRKRILVIDDEEILTRSFSKLLERGGYEVFVVKRGLDALEMAEEASFDLIICDIRMPGIDGIDTIVKLREGFRQRNLTCPPEIFITGSANEEDEHRAKQLKPTAYFWKPFDNFELLSAVRVALEKP